MTRATKVFIVVGGYVLALLVAFAAVWIHVAMTSGPDRQGASGMYAFGDSIFFLWTFGVAAVPATGAALFFLKPYRSFWHIISIAALAIATTAIAALLGYLMFRSANPGSALGNWAALAPLRILLAPLFGLGFGIALLFAPTRSHRYALLLATVVEATVFLMAALLMWHSAS